MDQVTRDAALRRRPRLTRVQVVAFSVLSWLIIFGVVPVEIARRGRRVGWRGGRPSVLNRLGVVVLGLGVSGLAWCLVAHYEPGETVPVSLTPEKLIGTGPYRLTRNPMYVSEEMTLIGWALLWKPQFVGVGRCYGCRDALCRGTRGEDIRRPLRRGLEGLRRRRAPVAMTRDSEPVKPDAEATGPLPQGRQQTARAPDIRYWATFSRRS